MTIQITIIGMGQIGASVGLALSGKTELLRRVGYDRDPKIARQAERIGAIDSVQGNLTQAVEGADLVLLALPIDQIRKTLELIAPDLRENAVVMDTSVLKEVVATWACELLPENRHYVGLTPAINPAYLQETGSGIDAARSDLFQKGLMVIVASPRANSEAVKLAVDLTGILGARPLFSDPVEVDGLMSGAHLLPYLMAAALLNATAHEPGWREGRKLAGRSYAEVSAPLDHSSEAQSLRMSVLFNKGNVLRVLDNAIASLSAIRVNLENQDEAALSEWLERAHKSRELWLEERRAGYWLEDGNPVIDTPDIPSFLGRMLGIGRKPKPKSNG
jgi:prephenate dehydrogenase